jgi:hypothetical protein
MLGNLPPMRTSAAAAEMIDSETGEVTVKTLPSDGSVHPGNASQFANHTQAARAKASGSSKRQQQKLDALAKAGRRDLLALISAGNMSVRKAMIAAGLEEGPAVRPSAGLP